MISIIIKNPFIQQYVDVMQRAKTDGNAIHSRDFLIQHSNVFRDLIEAGIMAKTDLFYMMTGDGSKEFKVVNWKTPTANKGTIIATVNTDNYQLSGDGVSGYINTNYTLSVHTVHHTQNSAGRAVWVRTDNLGFLDGANQNGYNCISTSNDAVQRINSAASLNAAADMTGTGWKSINRTSSTAVTLYNGTTSSSRTQGGTSLANIEQWIFRRLSAVGANNFTSSGLSCYWMGGPLNSTENSDFKTIIENHVNSI